MADTDISRGAAFFDVDRTLLAGASGLHLAAPFRKSGLLTARQVARTMLVQLAFSVRGSNEAQLDRYTEGVKELMAGWDQQTVRRVVDEELERRIHPMVYREALERIAMHQSQGQRVYAVSATLDDIVEPLAARLGLDGGIGTRMEVVDGAYTGEIIEANHGPAKADRVRAFAAEHDIDLAQSFSYSDSVTDADFLRLAGRPFAVNPDKELRQLAEAEGWGILRFSTRIRVPRYQTRAARGAALALATGVAVGMLRRRASGRRGA